MLRLTLIIALVSALPAQSLRYHVGLRMRAFERQFETQLADEATRKRVCPDLESAVTAFFGLRLTEVGRILDRAHYKLASADAVTPKQQFARAVAVYPERRLLGTDSSSLTLEPRMLYDVEGVDAEGLSLRVTLVSATDKVLVPAQAFPLAIKEPVQWKLTKLTEGDHRLRSEIVRDQAVLAGHEQVLSVAARFGTRIEAVIELCDTQIKDSRSATIRGLARLLRALHRGKTVETDVAAVQVLRDLEHLKKGGKLAANRTGDLRIWLAQGNRATACRLFIPAAIAKDRTEKRPLVLAMHGAGGSENLFFDGYGAGKTVALCAKRSWILLAPRSGILGGRSDAGAILDALTNLLPIDRTRVFGVGHSMGAGQLMADVSRKPDRYRAVAALGGGGRIKASAALRKLPVLVAAGDRDFGLRGSRSLDASLRRAGVEQLKFRTYTATEHLGIVQVALDDVFGFFDATFR